MATFHVTCFRDEYYGILERVAAQGYERHARGLKTRDLGYTTIYIHNPAQPVLPLHTGRRISKTVAAIEALQVIAGCSEPELLLAAAPRFADFMEPDPVTGEASYFHGAYGKRIGSQLSDALAKLKSDADSRQAVITLWDPRADNTPGKRDYPCTVALGLSIVDDALNLNVLMRSNDAWLGLPYDAFVFTQLQWTLAHALDVDIGQYIHTAWSLHIYASNLEDISRVGEATRSEYQPTGLVCSTYDIARVVATRMLGGDKILFAREEEEPDTYDWVDWYRDALAPVLG